MDDLKTMVFSEEHLRRHNGTRSQRSQSSPCVPMKVPKCSQCGERRFEQGLCRGRDRKLARWKLAGRGHFLRVAGWDDYLVLI